MLLFSNLVVVATVVRLGHVHGEQAQDMEPFTLGSLKPEVMKSAFEEARGKVFDYVADDIVEAVGVDTPDWVENMSMDAVEVIKEVFVNCIRDLDDTNLDRFSEMLRSVSSLDPTTALDRVLFPGGTSCSSSSAADDVSGPGASGLPDVSSAINAAEALSEHIYYNCLQGIDLGVLGFPVQEPQQRQRRHLGEDVCGPADDGTDKGFTVSLGGSVGANFGYKNTANNKQVKLRALVGATAEGGYDSSSSDKAGFGVAFSPLTIEVALRPKWTWCEWGYYCPGGGNNPQPIICPQGYFCPGDTVDDPKGCDDDDDDEKCTMCNPGFFCPPGSTTKWGEPIKDHQDCPVGSKCLCEAGYFCPKGSTTPKGEPVAFYATFADSAVNCEAHRVCKCPPSRYCVTGSTPKDVKQCPTATAALCSTGGCRNKKCTQTFGSTKTSMAEKYMSLFKKKLPGINPKTSFGVDLALNYYWDISASPWNGSNGFSIDFNLPLKFLPSISLIFNAPPLHCLGSGKYVVAGIGFGVISVRDLFNTKFGVLGEKWDDLMEMIDDDEIIRENENSELRIGASYTYDISFNDNAESKYYWCGTCESCDNCEQCAKDGLPESPANKTLCLANEKAQCRERRECDGRRLLRGTGAGAGPLINGGRSRSLESPSQSVINEFTELISTFSSIFSDNLNSKFCFGAKCEPVSTRDANSVIQGSIRAGYTQDCGGVNLVARIDDHLKISQVLSVLFGTVPSIGFVDKLFSFGVDGPLELALTVSGTSSLTLSARRPAEDSKDPGTSFGGTGNILDKILDFINDLQLEVYGKVERTAGGAAFEAGVCVSLGKDEGKSCLDPPSASPGSSSFAGIAVAEERLLFKHFGFQVGFKKPPAGGAPSAYLEISVGIKICPDEKCGEGGSEVLLEGSLRGELGVTGPTVGGGLQQVGTWRKAFGWDRLQLSDFLAKAQFGATFPVPDSLELGGRICVGTQADCDVAHPDNTVLAGAYVGFDSKQPTNNYLVAFLQKLTLGNILRALGMAQFSEALPKGLRDSGILRSKNAPSSCMESYELPTSVEEAALDTPGLELSCFAYIAISGREVTIPGITTPIQAGFAVSGRLLIQYGVELDLNVDASFNPITKAFKIDAEVYVALPKDDPVATFTGSDGTNSPAKFYVEKSGSNAAPSLAVYIDGMLKIDVINTSGVVKVLINSRKLQAEGSLNLLGVLHTSGSIVLHWDMSYFRVAIDEFKIGSGDWSFGFEDIFAEFRDLGGGNFKLDLGGKFQAGDYDVFEGKIAISKVGDIFHFDAKASFLCVVNLDVSGSLDLDDIKDSSIERFSLGADLGCLAEAAKFVADKAAEAFELAAAGLHDLEDDLKQACEATKADIGSSTSAAVVSGVTCLGGDIVGGLADALDAGARLLAGGYSKSGRVTKVLDGIDEIDCVLAIPPRFNADGTLNPFSVGQYQNVQSCFGIGNCCDFSIGGKDYDYTESGDVGDIIGGIYDPNECEKLAYYKSKTFTDYLHVWWDADCYNEIALLKSDVEPKIRAVETKEEVVVETRNGNACALGGQVKQDGAFELDTYEIIARPTEIADGQLLLKYKVKELENDGNGGCIVPTSLVNKTCSVPVPMGTSNLNLFIQRKLTLEFANCVVDDLMKDQTGVPLAKPVSELFTATLQINQSYQKVATTCTDFGNVEIDNKPHLEGEDATCKTAGRSPQFFYDDSDPVLVANDPNYPRCGTQKIVRTWTALDGCRRGATGSIIQEIFIVPSKPTFDASSLANVQVTTSVSPIPSYSTYPKATAYCGGRAEVDFEDVSIQTNIGDACHSWTMVRNWTAWEMIPGCTEEEVRAQHVSDPILQTVEITDDTKPEFVDAVEGARIPFFANYQPSNNVPRVRDGCAHFGYGDFGCQLVNGLSLSSADSAVMTSHGAPEATCSSDGLAWLNRTWSITDACSNHHQVAHKVTIEHPPKKLTTTGALEGGSFLRAVEVEQLLDVCAPGKNLTVGDKGYSVAGPRCQDSAWSGDGCQVISQGSTQQMDLLAIKPEFTFKPFNTTITTAESQLPPATGEAEGTSFCGTPFEIVYVDATPVKQNCGVWTIDRTWTIRPVYEDCNGDVHDSRLVDSFVQVITVRDIFAPEFIDKPAENLAVGFLANYGPDATGVPLVEDIATDPDIAKLVDMSGNPLVSYNITLTYDDVVSFPDPTTSDVCNEGAMTIIDRTWNTTDACAHSTIWLQTIRIGRPEEGLMGDASKFQVVTMGPAHLEHTDVAEDLATSGEDGTYMRHVMLATGSQTVSWDGTNPDGRPLDQVTVREQRMHEPPRGVSHNPSICRDNGLDYSLVTESCPKSAFIKDVFLMNKSAGYGPKQPLRGPASSRKAKQSQNIDSAGRGPINPSRGPPLCNLDSTSKVTFMDSSGGGNVGLDLFEEEPLIFGKTSDDIEAFSDQLAKDVPDLLTGPKFIECQSKDQNSCVEKEMSDSQQAGQVITKDKPNGGVGETMELIGSGMIYNFFTVKLEDWFFRLAKEPNDRKREKKKSPVGAKWDPTVVIKSPGFNFVNVKYQTELSTRRQCRRNAIFQREAVGVRHDFQSYIDGADDETTDAFYFDSPQRFGDQQPNVFGGGRSSVDDCKNPWYEYDLSKKMTNQWVPRRTIFDQGALGQEYFLVNIPNPEISNPDNVTDPKQLAAISLSFTDTKSITGSAVWTGTLLIGNKHTSISLAETTWLGGQIVLAGGKLELIQSTVLCGRFAANVPCPP